MDGCQPLSIHYTYYHISRLGAFLCVFTVVRFIVGENRDDGRGDGSHMLATPL